MPSCTVVQTWSIRPRRQHTSKNFPFDLFKSEFSESTEHALCRNLGTSYRSTSMDAVVAVFVSLFILNGKSYAQRSMFRLYLFCLLPVENAMWMLHPNRHAIWTLSTKQRRRLFNISVVSKKRNAWDENRKKTFSDTFGVDAVLDIHHDTQRRTNEILISPSVLLSVSQTLVTHTQTRYCKLLSWLVCIAWCRAHQILLVTHTSYFIRADRDSATAFCHWRDDDLAFCRHRNTTAKINNEIHSTSRSIVCLCVCVCLTLWWSVGVVSEYAFGCVSGVYHFMYHHEKFRGPSNTSGVHRTELFFNWKTIWHRQPLLIQEIHVIHLSKWL